MSPLGGEFGGQVLWQSAHAVAHGKAWVPVGTRSAVQAAITPACAPAEDNALLAPCLDKAYKARVACGEELGAVVAATGVNSAGCEASTYATPLVEQYHRGSMSKQASRRHQPAYAGTNQEDIYNVVGHRIASLSPSVPQ
jgi:hypothetical protein